jgi:hypothetical protein
MYLMCQNFAQKVEWVNKLEEVSQLYFLFKVYGTTFNCAFRIWMTRIRFQACHKEKKWNFRIKKNSLEGLTWS